MSGPFRVIAADPAWSFGDKLPGKRGADSHYSTLSWQDICLLELPAIADDAILFLWRVAAMQEEALAVMHMWGFDLKSELVWVKTKNGVVIKEDDEVDEQDLAFGMGRYTRHCHEVCLIGTRGKAASQVMKNHSVRSVFFAERLAHSEKPQEFFDLVEKMVGGEGPYLECFARKERPGWTTLGDELGRPMKVMGNLEGASNGSQDSGADGSGGASACGGFGARSVEEGAPRSGPGEAPTAAPAS